MGWSNLLDGYNHYSAYLADHGTPVTELWGSRLLQYLLLDSANNGTNIFEFLFYLFFALFTFTILVAVGYILLTTFAKRVRGW